MNVIYLFLPEEVRPLYKFYKVLNENITKVDSVLHGPSYYDAPTINYIAYIQDSKVYIAHSLIAVPRQLIVDRLLAVGTDVAVALKTEYAMGPNRTTIHRTTGEPQIFHVTNKTLFYRDGIEGSPVKIAEQVDFVSACYGWVDVLYGLEDQGLIVMYSSGRKIMCRSLLDGNWETPYLLVELDSDIRGLKVQRTPDYRMALTVHTSTGKKMLLTSRANVMSATQDNARFETDVKTTIATISVANPKNIKVVTLDKNTLQVEVDAPIIIKDGATPIVGVVYGGYKIPLADTIAQISPYTFTIKTHIDLGMYVGATFYITQSEYITTMGDTEIPSYEVPIAFNNVTPTELHKLDINTIYNAKGGK